MEVLDLSVVVPMFNEADGAPALVREISAALDTVDHEIIVVNDGSTDQTLAALDRTRPSVPRLRIISHTLNAGQSRALRTGVLAARARIIATLDGDGQNDPADIVKMYHALLAGKVPENPAMIAGERVARQDTASRKLASKIANGLRSRLLGDGIRDTGCGIKVFRRSFFLRLPYFDHMHRYLPALMQREGCTVASMPVSHRSRKYGRSKYGIFDRVTVGIRDLSGVMWLLKRARSPGNIREEG